MKAAALIAIWSVAGLVAQAAAQDDGIGTPLSFRDIQDDDLRVRSIGFEHRSDKPFRNRELRAAMATAEGKRFQQRFFRSDMRAIENLYRGQGYLDVDIVRRTSHTDARGRLHIRIEIDSGARWRVEAVDLVVADTVADAVEEDTSALRGLIGLEPGSPFLYGEILSDERALMGFLNNNGYAQARVANRVTLDRIRQSATVVYDIRPGRRMYFGPISIVDRRGGSSEKLRTRHGLVRRNLTFVTGERYDPQALRISRNNLANTDLFRSVTLEVSSVAALDSLQPVEVVLQERKFIHLEGSGFVNNSEPGISANLQHANWLGRGMRVGLDASLGRPLQGTTAYVTERDILRSGADLIVSAGVTDEWGTREVAADPSDSLQFALLTANDSVLSDFLFFAGLPAATEYIGASRFAYRSIQRLWEFNGTLARSWQRGSAAYRSHFGLTWTLSRNRPAGGAGRTLSYNPGDLLDDGGADAPPADVDFGDDPFGDDPFGDDPFGDDPFGDNPSGDDAPGQTPIDTVVDYFDGEIPVDGVWQRILTDEAKALNFAISFQRDSRDSQIKPATGSLVRAGGLYAVQVGGQATRVVDGDLEVRRYLRLGRNVVWANATKLLLTASLRQDRALPQTYWKALGGEGSVRGVEREGIQALGGGRAALIARSELRLTAGQYGLVVFWDRAGVWRHGGELSVADMTDGYGLGLRYDLGIPFRLDVGWSGGFSDRAVYFSIGQAY